MQNHFETAASDLTKALNINPGTYQTAETYSWIAYAHLKMHNASAANENLEKAKAKDARNYIYNFVAACANAAGGAFDLSLQLLERAIATSKFSENEIDDEPLLKVLRSDSKSKAKYKEIMKKYFP